MKGLVLRRGDEVEVFVRSGVVGSKAVPGIARIMTAESPGTALSWRNRRPRCPATKLCQLTTSCHLLNNNDRQDAPEPLNF